MPHQVYLFRHAEKESTGTGNPPLSLRGQSQALHLVQNIRDQKLPKPDRLLSSPKLRAIQSFFPCSQAFSLTVSEIKELDERQNSESAEQFSQRVRTQISWLSAVPQGVTFLVTHFDWVEEALIFIPSDTDLQKDEFHSWSPLRFIGFSIDDGLWKIEQQGKL